LREQLRDPLLVRVGSSFELTPRALELADRVHQMVMMIDDLVAPPTSVDMSQVKRHFTIMASEYSLLMVLPNVFRRAGQEAPGLSFEVVPIDNPVARVYSGDVDLCLTGNVIAGITGAAASMLRTSLLTTEEFIGLVDKAHPAGLPPSAESNSLPDVYHPR